MEVKRNEIGNNAEVSVNSSSFEWKSELIGNVAADGTVKNCKNSCTIEIFK